MPLDAARHAAAGSRRSPATAGSAGSRRSGSRDGRVAFAGSAIELETRADPHTLPDRARPRRGRDPGPDRRPPPSRRGRRSSLDRIDLTASPTLDDGLARIAAAHAALADADAWLEGHGWHNDRWGVWPTADDLERVAPGRARRALGARPPRPVGQPSGAGDRRDRRRPRRSGRRDHPARRGRRADGRPPRGRGAARDGPRPAADRASATRPSIARLAARPRPARRRRGPRSGRAVAPGGPRPGDRGLPASSTSAATCRSASMPRSARSSSTTAIGLGAAERRSARAARRPGPVRLAEAVRRRDARVADGRAPRADRAGGRAGRCRRAPSAGSG